MTDEQLIRYIGTCIGIPYLLEHEEEHAINVGFNCRTWASHLYHLKGWTVKTLTADYKSLKDLRKEFYEINGTPQFFDVALFSEDIFASRHIGLMLDTNRFTHCSIPSNGVAISYLDRQPFPMLFQGFYRFK